MDSPSRCMIFQTVGETGVDDGLHEGDERDFAGSSFDIKEAVVTHFVDAFCIH